jgi:hypothetical protein
VRWEALFADLEMQWEAAEAAEFDLEVADRSRREAGYLRLVDRMRPAVGCRVHCTLRVGGSEPAVVAGRLAALGMDWFLVEESAAQEVLVPMAALTSVTGLGATSAQPGHEGPLAARLDLRHVLRQLVRDRSPCVVGLTDGARLAGTAARVGADFVEVLDHSGAEYLRARDVRAVRTVPLHAIAFVRRG